MFRNEFNSKRFSHRRRETFCPRSQHGLQAIWQPKATLPAIYKIRNPIILISIRVRIHADGKV
ncbi:MAG: hypothetical protein WC765_04325, partial [Phycisphaerae bacterium]